MKKGNKRYIGIVFIVAGVALAYWGFGIYDSAGSKIGRALTGDTPVKAWAGMIGGAVLALFGILQVK